MPDISRSSVDLPAPLCPTRPTRSPVRSDSVMSRNASMTRTFDVLRPIVPPALPRNVFFSDRDFASKIGNSTHAPTVSMLTSSAAGPPCGSGPGLTPLAVGSKTDTVLCLLQVLSCSRVHGSLLRSDARWQRPLAHVLELRPRRHLLREQRRLDAVEQALQPADQLGLRDPQLGIRWRRILAERQRQPLELIPQLRGQPLFELPDAGRVDLAQPVTAGVVQRGGAHLLEQLLDHRADPHHLGRLLDKVGHRGLVVGGVLLAAGTAGAVDDLDVVVVGAGTHVLTCSPQLAPGVAPGVPAGWLPRHS